MRGAWVLTVAAASLLGGPWPTRAMTLSEAIGLAVKHDPGLRQAEARRDAARARLGQARAARLPSLVASGSVAYGPTDFGGFFGFRSYDLKPRTAALSLQQPLFTGGAISAAIAQARSADDAASASVEDTRLGLSADVAQAYVSCQVARSTLELVRAQVRELGVVLDQARLRFQDGEIPRSEMNQAEARLSAGEAAASTAEGDLAKAEAHFRALVGAAPLDLAPPGAAPATPATQAEAVAEAQAHSLSIRAARSSLDAAEAGVRRAKADRWPTVALAAEASSVRDQFLPGYRADGVTVGVQGRWTLFDGGRTSGKISEASAERGVAQAALDQARSAAEEAAIDAWQARRTADLVAAAAADQTKAADAALDSVKNEVRVGQKPTLDLLDAEREALAARIAVLQANGAKVVSAYRLNAVIGSDSTP